MSCRAAITGLLAFASVSYAQSPGLWLTGVAPGATYGGVSSLSRDGSVAAGGSALNIGYGPGFTWTRSGGRYDFGLEPGMPASTPASGLNDDGTTLVGSMWSGTSFPAPSRAFRRVGNGPLQDLGVLSGTTRSYTNGVSGDGSTVVGASEFGPQNETSGQAFRWTVGGGMQGLGFTRPFGTFSEAKAVSRDGSTIVGWSQSLGGFGPVDAFVWTQAGGIQALPKLPGSPTSAWGEANAVSANGQVIVGSANSPDLLANFAVRWTGSGIQSLGVLPGYLYSHATAVSDNGEVIGGSLSGGGFEESAFVWTPTTGMVLLSDYLVAAGLSVPANYRLENITAISGDGRTFGGAVRNLTTNQSDGYIATVPSPSTLLILLLPALKRRRCPAA